MIAARPEPVRFKARVRIDTPREVGILPPWGYSAVRFASTPLHMTAASAKSAATAKRTATAKSTTPKVLLDLLAARGPSGYETAPAAVWRDAAKRASPR